ncbi:MAG: MarR family transcriptional regulator [Sphingobium sp.]|nr:MarR family transcriptional regulator [Sphingobium sp.]
MTKSKRKKESEDKNGINLPPELQNAVGFYIRRSISVADTIFSDVFGPFEITTQYYAILLTMRSNPGCQPSHLSALLGMTPNNLVPRIAHLVDQGFVKRTESKNDRRIKHLHLTPAGEEYAAKLAKMHDEVHARVVARMGQENAREFLRLLYLYCGEDYKKEGE